MEYGYACGNGHGKDMIAGSEMKINDATRKTRFWFHE